MASLGDLIAIAIAAVAAIVAIPAILGATGAGKSFNPSFRTLKDQREFSDERSFDLSRTVNRETQVDDANLYSGNTTDSPGSDNQTEAGPDQPVLTDVRQTGGGSESAASTLQAIFEGSTTGTTTVDIENPGGMAPPGSDGL